MKIIVEIILVTAIALAILGFCFCQYAYFLAPHTQVSAGWVDIDKDALNLIRAQALPESCTRVRYVKSNVAFDSLTVFALKGATVDLENLVIPMILKAHSVEIFEKTTECPFTIDQIRMFERTYCADLSWIPVVSQQDCIAFETVGIEGRPAGTPRLYLDKANGLLYFFLGDGMR